MESAGEARQPDSDPVTQQVWLIRNKHWGFFVWWLRTAMQVFPYIFEEPLGTFHDLEADETYYATRLKLSAESAAYCWISPLWMILVGRFTLFHAPRQ